MNQRYRVPLILASAGAVGCIMVTLAAREIAIQHLTNGMPDRHEFGNALHHLQYQIRALGILATLAAAFTGWFIGVQIMAPFERLRSELVAGSISNVPVDVTSRWSPELYALKHAALRHEAALLRETQLKALESADLRLLLDTVSEGLVQLDSTGRVMQANPAALELLALPDNIRGRMLASLVRHVELRQIITRATSGELIHGAEIALDDRELLISAIPIRAESSGEVSSSAIAIADLTRIRRLEGVRRDFVANVSHELKTPLTSINGYAETLLADETLPPEMRRPFLEVIHRNAVRLQRIVDDLLDLSRIESGAWQPELQEVDARDVALEVWSGCELIAKNRKVTFVPLSSPVHVVADPHGLRQVFSNLFDNALRYTPEGGSIALAATPGTRGDNGHRENVVELAVQDTGIGIPREALPRIFERFYRVDPARSRAEGGTGLGLSIVKHTVDSMHGEVAAVSEVGRGTTILVTLPSA